MTLDAMDWVWRFSRTRGNARLAVLYVADQVRTLDCEVRLSTTDFMFALGVRSRQTASAAVDAALETKDLEIKEEGRGSRPPLYRLPLAVGHRQGDAPPVPNPGTQSEVPASASVPDLGTQSPARVPNLGTEAPEALVPNLGTLRTESRYGLVPDFGPISPTHVPKSDRAIDAAPPAATDSGIPDFARPLVDGLTLADVSVRWPFTPVEWLKVHAAIKKSDTPALIDYARRVYKRQRGEIDSARYFLRGWTELPPVPSPDAQRPPLRAISGGYQPWTNPTNHDAYDEDL